MNIDKETEIEKKLDDLVETSGRDMYGSFYMLKGSFDKLREKEYREWRLQKKIDLSPVSFPSFAIGIPTFNRWDLLRPALYVYLSNFPNTRVYVLDNGSQQKDVFNDRITYIDKNSNIGVAASWNELCRKIFADGNQYALILNDDITLAQNEYEIGNYLFYEQGSIFRALGDWCAFAISSSIYKEVGPFDEAFKAYYEDNDYEYRVKLKQKAVLPKSWLSPMVYRNNSTGDKDPSVYQYATLGKRYYLSKWGGPPGSEKWTQAFGKT